MSSPEWSRYVREELGVDLPPERISEEVVARLAARYRQQLPLLPGAREAVERLAQALAAGARVVVQSRADRPRARRRPAWRSTSQVTVSSEEVGRGKPAPDVYLEAAGALGVGSLRLRRDRGLAQRHPVRGRRRDARDRDSEPGISRPARRRLRAAARTLGSLDALTVEVVGSRG